MEHIHVIPKLGLRNVKALGGRDGHGQMTTFTKKQNAYFCKEHPPSFSLIILIPNGVENWSQKISDLGSSSKILQNT